MNNPSREDTHMQTASPSSFKQIGFVGLGGMGRGIVRNLLRKGLDVLVHDRDAAAFSGVSELGARWAELDELFEQCDLVLLCVSRAEDVAAMVIEPGSPGEKRQNTHPLTLVDHTTTNPAAVDRFSATLATRGWRYVEAPMTRTPVHAEAGKVNILYGGDAATLEQLRPVFSKYAENMFHVGPVGHGIRLKLIHNFISFSNVLSWCEGFALAAKEGMDLRRVIEIISAAGGKSGMLDLYGQATLDGDFTPLMSLANATKDVAYYARWIEQAGMPGFFSDAVHQSYRMAELGGHDAESCTAVIKFYEEITGVAARLKTGDA